jgi:hypothetical protein
MMLRTPVAISLCCASLATMAADKVTMPCNDEASFNDRTLAACLSVMKVTDPGDVLTADRSYLVGGNLFTITTQSAPGVVHICAVKSAPPTPAPPTKGRKGRAKITEDDDTVTATGTTTCTFIVELKTAQ